MLPAAGPEARATRVAVHPENFEAALTKAPFGRYVLNTLFIVALATVGTLASSVLVAYGFSRFPVPGTKPLFILLLGTVMLPSQVTLIPTFVLSQYPGWYDTWMPLIVPAFFANAWDVFLLRQFFMSLSPELDDAAKIDGCGPLRIQWNIILPQRRPVLLTVGLFTAIYVWNDFFGPLIYLQDPKLYTGALMMLLPPLLAFFLAQKYFIKGTSYRG